MKKIIIVILVLLCLSTSLFATEYYITLRNTDIDRLISAVNKKVDNGWLVSGGITQAIDSMFTGGESKLYYYVLMYDSKLIQP